MRVPESAPNTSNRKCSNTIPLPKRGSFVSLHDHQVLSGLPGPMLHLASGPGRGPIAFPGAGAQMHPNHGNRFSHRCLTCRHEQRFVMCEDAHGPAARTQNQNRNSAL